MNRTTLVSTAALALRTDAPVGAFGAREICALLT